MKSFAKYGDRRLSAARKEIAELKRQNIALRLEITSLRASGACVQPGPRSAPLVRTPSDNVPHYAQATKSSLGKIKEEPPESQPPRNANRASCVIERDNGIWVYKNGVPIMVAPGKHPWSPSPNFMETTTAAMNRERQAIRSKPPPTRDWSTVDTERGWGDAETVWSLPPTQAWAPTWTPIQYPQGGGAAGLGLAQRSRLEDRLDFGNTPVVINSRTALDLLRRAAELVQGAIYKVGHVRRPGWRHFRDGPHVVLLGRDELMNWLGEFSSPELAYNGYSSSMVYSAILDSVYLRNTICHPHSYELQRVDGTERLLTYAQKLTVVLGDEERAMELRDIRDTLRDLANESQQQIRDMYYLAAQPHSVKIKLLFHHQQLMESIASTSDPEGTYGTELSTVAEAWMRYRDMEDEDDEASSDDEEGGDD